jgi:hypothetical protein
MVNIKTIKIRMTIKKWKLKDKTKKLKILKRVISKFQIVIRIKLIKIILQLIILNKINKLLKKKKYKKKRKK